MRAFWHDLTAGLGIIYRSLCGAFAVSLFVLILSIAGSWLYAIVLAPQQLDLKLLSVSVLQVTSGVDGSFSLLLGAGTFTALTYLLVGVAVLWYTVELTRQQRSVAS